MSAEGLAPATWTASDVAARVRQFEQDGFVVARGMFSPSEMRDFIAECQSFEGRSNGREPNSKGSMQFYSQIFRKSELVRRFVCQRKLIDFIAPITGPDLWLRWDQAVAKGPDSGVFDWHTDAGYDLLPQPHFEVWIALSESRHNNGGLCVIPGSHKQRTRHRRVGTHVISVDAASHDVDGRKQFIEADAGDVILFSSLLLHKTYENTTTSSRWAYVAELLKLGDFDPTIAPPYFIAARNGQPACEFVDRLACARDPRQIALTLPLAIRHRVAGPLVRRLRAAFKSSTPTP